MYTNYSQLLATLLHLLQLIGPPSPNYAFAEFESDKSWFNLKSKALKLLYHTP